MEPDTPDNPAKARKDESTRFGQGQVQRTVTQDEQDRMRDDLGQHARGQGRPGSRPTSKR